MTQPIAAARDAEASDSLYPFAFTNSFMNVLTCSHASIGQEL